MPGLKCQPGAIHCQARELQSTHSRRRDRDQSRAFSACRGLRRKDGDQSSLIWALLAGDSRLKGGRWAIGAWIICLTAASNTQDWAERI